ncbi:hypothetical protein [Flavobacterium selenitireducens]|uniref:hypothetical protein n=1 Tax=Flavobacterium selenitireducens TaxID=2722704 RepID=UPI00168AC52C|nr:hypothetical protein [Flavobacterium selenitireducens]MBD3583567.1 hypothetical protein [Flavobacterium selenitireducens]
MKKLFFLVVAMIAAIGCSDDDRPSANFNSTTVLDGTEFNPVRGTYFEAVPDMHRHVIFRMDEGQGSVSNMSIDLYIPFTQSGITGQYDMGIGEADDALASVYLSNGMQSYYISSINRLKVTELGNSRFKFEFIDAYGLVFQGGTVPFSGMIEGRFDLTAN